MKRLFRKLFGWPQSVAYRLRHGFHRSDLWNLDDTVARFVLPRLRELKVHTWAYPGDMSNATWHIIVDKIIFSFATIVAENEGADLHPDLDGAGSKEFFAFDEEIQEGLDLFGRYFRALWW